jgi:CDP-6-deoxy-D-xylo-4-hexulose-3-dehydrase
MIKLIKSTFYKEEDTKKQLNDFISQAEILSFGPQCQLFEKSFSSYQGRSETVFVNSGSSANLAVIQALLNLGKINKGDKVGFSAVTWSTNTMPLIQLGLEPVPIDVELDTLNISAKKAIEAIEKFDLKMIFLTNLLGFCDDIEKITEVCESHNVLLIEDNCESLGSVYKGKNLGNYGYASTFSFYVGHHMSTVEGGAVCTDDEDLVTMLRLVRAHGWDRNLSLADQTKIRDRFNVNSTFYSRYTFYDLGYNLRPTEINGFLGNNQLEYLDEIVEKRSDNFKDFSKLYENKKYYPLKFDHIEQVSNFAVPIVCKSHKTRNELVDACEDKVEIRPIVGGNMTEQPFFQKYISNTSRYELKNASLIHQNGLYFGNNPELTKKEIGFIINIFA